MIKFHTKILHVSSNVWCHIKFSLFDKSKEQNSHVMKYLSYAKFKVWQISYHLLKSTLVGETNNHTNKQTKTKQTNKQTKNKNKQTNKQTNKEKQKTFGAVAIFIGKIITI